MGMDPRRRPRRLRHVAEADSVGVFQSRAGPRCRCCRAYRVRFYDLVIEVAIVRPGPIQGGMVHPYLRRARRQEKGDLSQPRNPRGPEKDPGRPAVSGTGHADRHGAAGFTPEEADKLRRAMATFVAPAPSTRFKEEFINGMVATATTRFRRAIFKQIEGFGEYGFPESHAASFALLVYVSSWLKCYYPEVFAAALLNCQPMGFYARTARARRPEHGVEVRPPDVNDSEWDCTLERPSRSNRCALRLGLRQVDGPLPKRYQAHGRASHRALSRSGRSVASFRSQQAPDPGACPGRCLRFPGTLPSRRVVGGARLFRCPGCRCSMARPKMRDLEPAVSLAALTLGERVVDDYGSISMSLRSHPLALLRPTFPARRGAD